MLKEKVSFTEFSQKENSDLVPAMCKLLKIFCYPFVSAKMFELHRMVERTSLFITTALFLLKMLELEQVETQNFDQGFWHNLHFDNTTSADIF